MKNGNDLDDFFKGVPPDFFLFMLACITAGAICYFGLRWVKRKFKV